MQNDARNEKLPGEDWRSKAESKGERHTADPLAIALARSRERGRGREAGTPKRSRRSAGATFSGAC